MRDWSYVAAALTLALLAGGCADKATAPAPPPARLTTPHIAFSSNRSGSIGIHLYDPATGQIVRVSPYYTTEQEPAISPDGTRIAFAYYEKDGRFLIWTMAVDGRDRKRLTDELKRSDTGPHWSPDGRYLVFTRTNLVSGGKDVWVMRAGGDSLRSVTGDGRSTALDWSPDGARLLFVRDSTYASAQLNDVRTCDVDGSHPLSLTGFLAWNVAGADYSPDGRYIALTYGGSGSPRLGVCRPDGTGFTPIGPATDFSTVGGIGHPSWSPDGLTVVLSGHRDGETDDLYTVYVPNGSEPAPLLTGAPWESGPDWGPKP